MALAIALVVAGAATLNRSIEELLAGTVFLSLTVAGCAIVFLSVRPFREFPQAVGLALILWGLAAFVLKARPTILSAVAFLGISSLLLLAVRRIWSEGTEQQILHDSVVPPLLLVLMGYFGSAPLALTDKLHPRTFDLLLYRFDQSLGVQLSFKVGQIVLPSLVITRGALAVYYMLPIVIMFAYAMLLVRDRTQAMTAFLAFVITGPLGVVFYNLIPGCGPVYLLGSRFPFEPLSTQQLAQWPLEALSVAGPRNAFPSLHLGWALLVWWYGQALSLWTKIAFAIFLLGTIVATLGLGEHYFVDLVTAFPFALMIQAACALNVPISNPRRILPLVGGLVLMLGWVILLRWGLSVVLLNPVVPWLLVSGTITLTLFLQAELRQAERS